MKSSLMKLNPVSTFSGEGQIQIMHTWSKSWVVDFRKKFLDGGSVAGQSPMEV
jgi:hypothetical protein